MALLCTVLFAFSLSFLVFTVYCCTANIIVRLNNTLDYEMVEGLAELLTGRH